MFSNKLMIADHLAYRYYGNELIIVMDWKTARTHILRNKAAEIWKQFDNNKTLDNEYYLQNHSDVEKLAQIGLLVSKKGKGLVVPQSNTTHTSLEEKGATLQIVDQWAARNFIPINGSFSVTGKCNLRCAHCYSVHKHTHALSTEQVISILDELKSNGNLALTLTGGELFTRSDYREILNHMCKNKFSIKINSNGTYINETVIQDISEYPQLSHLHISLYSSDPNVHDGITKVEGSFARTVQALKLLKETDKIIRINCSVMKSNADSYRGVKEQIGDSLDIPVRYDSRLVPINSGDKTNLEERVNNEQIASFYNWLLDNGSIDAQSFLHPKMQLDDEQIGLCSAGFSYFEVSEDGDLFPCFQLRIPLGSLLKDNFASLWKESAFLNHLRNATPETLSGCIGCTMKSICNLCIGMSHLEDGNIFGKSSECCRDSKVRYNIGIERDLIRL